jgi:hypothetical protein
MKLHWTRALTLALVLAAAGARAQTTTTTMSVRDGTGTTQVLRSDRNGDGSLATHNVPEVGGAAVSPTNPMPIGVTPGTLAYTASTTGSAGTSSGTLITAAQYHLVKICTLFSSTSNVWLGMTGGTAAVGSGLGIPAGGGCKTLGSADTPMPTSAITAITDGGSAQTVTIVGG